MFYKVYSFLTYVGVPFFLCRLMWKGKKNKDYLKRIGERFGFANFPPRFSCDVWFHAVSVGEVKAVTGIIKRLLAEDPQMKVLITTTTPTGSEVVKKDLKNLVYHTYFPLDLPLVIEKFLKKVKPSLVVIVETEIWPNLFLKCYEKNIPLIMINARISPSSFRNYKLIYPFIKDVLNKADMILARSKEDANRFISLGVSEDKVCVVGDIKFDIEVDEKVILKGKELRKTFFDEGKKIWICASTHRGEEELIIKVFKEVLRKFPNLKLILAPRHPERVQEILNILNRYDLTYHLRSDPLKEKNYDVLVIDTLGELMYFYAASDLAFVGGSLVSIGGHNLLEPASLGLPILTGNHLHNFEEVRDLLLKNQALIVLNDEKELKDNLINLLEDEDKRRGFGERAKEVVEKNRGSSLKVISVIKDKICSASKGFCTNF